MFKEARREVQKSMVGYSMPKAEAKSQKNGQSKVHKEELIHARELAKKQREISIAEFFEKNRHLLGFDNPRKALLTTIKEAVDNSLDACEEARILPEVTVELIQLGETRFRIIIEDNGPGIVKQQIPKIFAKLLYGSKFHKLSQSLTAEQPFIIENKGRLEVTTIGAFVDSFIEEGEKDIFALNIKVPAFDWKNYKYSFQPISRVIKHRQNNEIYEIKLQSGRKIKVTGCHSLFSLDSNLKVQQTEARELKMGDYLIAPKKLPEPETLSSIELLDYISAETAQKQYWYVYGLSPGYIREVFSNAWIIHKKTSKSRKYHHFENIDVLDDSYKQYLHKGFLPAYLAIKLKLRLPENSYLQTYHHGKITKVPLDWPLSSSFMRFLGLFTAEGHADHRQAGFTFGRQEKDLIGEVTNFALMHGMDYTLENREEKNCVRVKVFGGLLSHLLERWCGKGAKNKHIPDFVFSSGLENRQHFIDALYRGDGHNTKGRNQLMHTTVSQRLANELMYLWLMQGVIAHQSQKTNRGLGKTPSVTYITTVYGKDIEKSFCFRCNTTSKTNAYRFLPKQLIPELKRSLSPRQDLFQAMGVTHCKFRDFSNLNQHNITYLQRKRMVEVREGQVFCTPRLQLLQEEIPLFFASDLCLLKIVSIERLDLCNEWVYDVSVPGVENFVGGWGGMSAHNSRGQQGIGISAAVLYAQLTTGKPALITSKTDAKSKAAQTKLKISTSTNEPEIIEEIQLDWPEKEHGTKIEIELEGVYLKGRQSVDEYLKETAIVNPHVTIIYVNPEAQQTIFPRAANELPAPVKEILPHPYGVELGILIKMLENTSSRTLQSFLTDSFSRVSPAVAKEICENSAVLPNIKPDEITREMAERLIEGIKKTKIIAPSTDCISPIGEEQLEKGLRKGITAEFYCAATRPAAVYRGNPFVIEVALAYGGELPKDQTVRVLRFANRVPLLYQPGACAISESVNDVAWKSYGLEQSRNSPPVGPCVIVVHMSSVWVPFTSESKEAIAHYPEIIKEIKLGLQECGRLLGIYVRKKTRIHEQMARADMFEKFLPELADSLASLAKENKEKILKALQKMLVRPEIKQEILAGGEEDKLYKMELSDKGEEKEDMQRELNGEGKGR